MPIESVKKEIEDRVSSPLRGAYFLAVISLNWKAALVFLDLKLSAAEKIAAIDNLLPTWWWKLSLILIFPLAIAFLFNFVITWVEYYPQRYKLQKLKELEEVNRHQTEAKKLAVEYHSQLDSLTKQMRGLLIEIDRLSEMKRPRGNEISGQDLKDLGKRFQKPTDDAMSFLNEKARRNSFPE